MEKPNFSMHLLEECMDLVERNYDDYGIAEQFSSQKIQILNKGVHIEVTGIALAALMIQGEPIVIGIELQKTPKSKRVTVYSCWTWSVSLNSPILLSLSRDEPKIIRFAKATEMFQGT